MANNYKFEVVYHLLSVAAFWTMPVEYIQALLSHTKLLVSLWLLLTGCRKGLPLLGKDFLMRSLSYTRWRALQVACQYPQWLLYRKF